MPLVRNEKNVKKFISMVISKFLIKKDDFGDFTKIKVTASFSFSLYQIKGMAFINF
jgi:hypothetical protein